MIVVETRPRAPDFSPLSTCCSAGWATGSATAMDSPPHFFPPDNAGDHGPTRLAVPQPRRPPPSRRVVARILRFSHKVDPSATVSVVFHLNRDRSSSLAGL